MNTHVLDWLLEEDNPGVRLRALSGLCERPDNNAAMIATRRLVIETLGVARDLSWMQENGIRRMYNLTALAECGLTRDDVPVDPAVDALLALPFDANCGDYMLLRALVMLGYGADGRVLDRLAQACETQLPDGGWTCLHRLNKMSRTPKSCMKAAMHALLMAGEMAKRGMTFAGTNMLIPYFLKRQIFYRMDDPTQLALYARTGARMTDAYFPIELMRVGLPHLLDSLSSLGVGCAPELREAWSILDAKQDAQFRTKLEGTLSKSYLPKERVGRPGKWVTLYACLAHKALDNQPCNGGARA